MPEAASARGRQTRLLTVFALSLAAMCGIAGTYALRGSPPVATDDETVLGLLHHRGPDSRATKAVDKVKLYHTRLKIVDTSEASDQPFGDDQSGRWLTYNGEIFNYRELSKGMSLRSEGDTEVLFNLLASKGKECLPLLNGFFSFAYYDRARKTLLLARDRFGVKPLYYSFDGNAFAFASELKPLMELAGPRPIDSAQLYTYLRLNFCAGPQSIFSGVLKLEPGHWLEVSETGVRTGQWYRAAKRESRESLYDLLDDAVRIRLHADVPVGAFLSGGLDSSIVSALARRHKADLHTFSVGFPDAAYYDETRYAEIVATHIGSNHHVFALKEDDFISSLDGFLASIDEPFADASAFNYYVLSAYTAKYVKVALSGDGADELFRGYRKHRAQFLAGRYLARTAARALSPALSLFSSSRGGFVRDKTRQFKRFAEMARLGARERSAYLASISTDREARDVFTAPPQTMLFETLFAGNANFPGLSDDEAFDMATVLADDMLVKSDRFSMRHALEVREPFLDPRVVEFALGIPEDEKISRAGQKLPLRKHFAHLLPAEVLLRSKKGFEVPLGSWLTKALRSRVENEWLNRDVIGDTRMLSWHGAGQIRKQLFSKNQGDSPARAWAIIVFVSWLKSFHKYISVA